MTQIFKFLVVLLLLSCTIWSCVKQNSFSEIPSIQFIGQTKNMLHQGALMEDSLFIRFSFQDGDGDIGDQDSVNVFLTDTRQDFATTYRIPILDTGSSIKTLEGEITMLVFTTCCIYDDNSQAPCTPSSTQPTDEVIYTLHIRDRAGNMSNIVELNPITIMCD